MSLFHKKDQPLPHDTLVGADKWPKRDPSRIKNVFAPCVWIYTCKWPTLPRLTRKRTFLKGVCMHDWRFVIQIPLTIWPSRGRDLPIWTPLTINRGFPIWLPLTMNEVALLPFSHVNTLALANMFKIKVDEEKNMSMFFRCRFYFNTNVCIGCCLRYKSMKLHTFGYL